MSRGQVDVLLVEDNPGDARLVCTMLEHAAPEQFRVEHVRRLDQARLMIERGHFDAVLLDLTLPDSRGPHTVTRLRDHARQIPIVVLTGHREDQAIPSLQQGAQAFFVKETIDAHALVRSIVDLVSKQEHPLDPTPGIAQESADLFETIIGTIPEGVLVHDADGTILLANRVAKAHLGCAEGDRLAAYTQTGAIGSISLPDAETSSWIVERAEFGNRGHSIVILRQKVARAEVAHDPTASLAPERVAVVFAELRSMAWRVQRLHELLGGIEQPDDLDSVKLREARMLVSELARLFGETSATLEAMGGPKSPCTTMDV